MSSRIRGVIEIILYAQDMNAQVQFYRDKLGLMVRSPTDLSDYGGEYWVELETGACTLVLHGGGLKRIGADTPKVVFGVDDIVAARDELLLSGVTLGEVRSPAPGVLVVDGSDPEGNTFSLEQHA